jgi:NRPS condensation-like uncharacterized protein
LYYNNENNNKEMLASEGYFLTSGQRYLFNRLKSAPTLCRPFQRVYRFKQNYKYSEFLKALQYTVSLHPALRLKLNEEANSLTQHFPKMNIDVTKEEVKGIGRLFRSIYANILIKEEGKPVMDLKTGPPLKAKVVMVNGESLLSVCIDHISVDEIAFDNFEKELVENYSRLCCNLPLPDIESKSFSEYILREVKQRSRENENLLYWQNHLKEAPIYFPAPVARKMQPASFFKLQLKGDLYTSIFLSCKRYKCSLFNIIVASQLLLLFAIDKSTDAVIGIPISNRSRPQDHKIIGNLVSPLYVRFTVSPNELVENLIQRTRDTVLASIIHKQYDYSSLIRFLLSIRQSDNSRINLSKGCSFIVHNEPLQFPNPLFVERVNLFSSSSTKVPIGYFTVGAHQYKQALSIDLAWDRVLWPVRPMEMKEKYQKVIELISNVGSRTCVEVINKI